MAVGKINDAVRYTLTLPEASYTAGVQRAVQLLKDAGFKEVELKNFWMRNADVEKYRGINTTWWDETTKQTFEFQLHTADSLAAKEAEHLWYDWQRLPNVPQIELDYAAAQSRQIFGSVSFPDGAVRIPQFP